MRRIVVLLALACPIAGGCDSRVRSDPAAQAVANELRLKRLTEQRADVEEAYDDVIRISGKLTDEERADYYRKTKSLDKQIAELNERLR